MDLMVCIGWLYGKSMWVGICDVLRFIAEMPAAVCMGVSAFQRMSSIMNRIRSSSANLTEKPELGSDLVSTPWEEARNLPCLSHFFSVL